MFPRSFIFLILIFVVDMILKSVKDKSKMEKARRQRKTQLEESPRKEKPIIFPMEENHENRKAIKIESSGQLIERKSRYRQNKDRKTLGKYKREEKDLTNISKGEIGYIEDGRKISKEDKTGLRQQFKKDILKGVIFSEILSKPKSLRNNKKTI